MANKKEKKKIITIGIDSSTTNCGVAIYENGKFINAINYKFDGTFDLNKLKKIILGFDELFETYGPDLVVIEETVPIRNSRAVTSLNQVFGAIVSLAMAQGSWVNQVHNKVCKSTFKYKTKEEAIAIAKKLTKIKREITEHEADAILVVETYKKIIFPEGMKE